MYGDAGGGGKGAPTKATTVSRTERPLGESVRATERTYNAPSTPLAARSADASAPRGPRSVKGRAAEPASRSRPPVQGVSSRDTCSQS